MEANSNPTATSEISTSLQPELQPTQPVNPTPSQKNNIKMATIIVIVVLLLAAVGAAAFFMGTQQTAQPPVNSPITPEETICTLEAKICPDGSAVGRSGPNCEFAECPTQETTSTSSADSSFNHPTLIVAAYVNQDDESGQPDYNSKANIVIELPPGSIIEQGSEKSVVTVVGEKYEVATNVITGLCPMEDDTTGCRYDDETFANADMLRIWKNNQGIFALNLISINVNDYYLNNIIVTKASGEPFTTGQVSLWKDLLSILTVENLEL